MLQETDQGILVPFREERLTRRAESIGIGRRTRPSLLPAVRHETLGFEFHEVPAHGIGGHTKSIRKLFCGNRLRLLELQ